MDRLDNKIIEGFTLIELMITVSVAAILLTVGVPSFLGIVENNRQSVNANTLLSSINLARSEAVRRNSRVTMCKSANGTTCSDILEWEDGWMIYVDAGDDGSYDPSPADSSDPADTLLKASPGLPSTDTIRVTSGNVTNYISFVSTGASRLFSGSTQSGAWVVCVNGEITTHTRVIDINQTGRARVLSADDAGVDSCETS